MAPTPPQTIEDLAARLERERANADRRYNDALTALDAAIGARTELPAPPDAPDTSRVPDINASWNILPDGAPPIDRSIRGRLRGLVWRLAGPPLETQKRFNALVVDYINRDAAANRAIRETVGQFIEVVSRERDALARFESLLVQYAQTITEYVDSRDRAALASDLRERVGLAEQRILGLKRELEAVPGAVANANSNASPPGGDVSAPFRAGSEKASSPVFGSRLDSVTYVGFEDRFRGPQREIRARIEDYLPMLASSNDIVDIGCGRGELLAALRDRGVRARGVDMNAGMVELCRAAGLEAERDDALSFLDRQADGSIGGLAAVQVVEHFEPAYLARFLETAYHKLRPGSPLILETINPACWMAFFETYIRDLTHQRPLHPDTLRFLVESSGFTSVDVQFRQPVGEGDRLPHVKILGDTGSTLPRNIAQLADAVNAHADKLNARMFSSMDYAVIARR